ncbi:unconventional myosin-Vc [Callorhinchus milii]|uniref:unconventional myosin-Vc n=1 Tax=Callorhinchus milii TaxID=7868 RepID=UPI0004571E52|nr:unconventional myosin-Vc [Callorhinchus milii]|eukprot:gi/632938257/ref/XP_007904330.1/ PREDICTED: unconventional myosin-Vc [Callorhinchus milii]
MAVAELYTKYNRVWIPDSDNVWKSAEITSNYKKESEVLNLELEDGTELQYPVDLINTLLPPLRNPDILVGENDLTALSYLHEPAVLHNLRVRFVDSKLIYTYCGIILVAINPYKQVPIYGDAIIHAYSGQNMGDMDPHIFAVSEEAYKQMARNNKNQSIIVSGESGAGKTVSARYAMRYFATVSKSSSKACVEDKVLASNPITEAIGNAKTTRNDNSSRFGKYTEISFDNRYRIIGANMRTYLLEKSRVVFQAENERNYHIFYQLCASADQPKFKHLKLGPAEHFSYMRMGGNTSIDGVDDRADMIETQKTFLLLGLNEDLQIDIFKVLAAILHFGNVEIRAVSEEKSSVKAGDAHLKVFCELLSIKTEEIAHGLCHRKISTTSDTVIKPMTKAQAINARDAVSKHIYAHLFNCIVERINRALQFDGKQYTFIGVLDIYGFETFDMNSFEQFCINYANEKLQQQFNLHVFKLEQDEYMKEDIPWTLIEFNDNQPCIDLIEAKMGILELLDEECLLPQGTEENWLQKLHNNFLNKNPLFEKPRMFRKAFIIQHFADKVQYESDGFLEKNRDTLYDELINVLKKSKLSLLADFFQDDESSVGNLKPHIKVKPARPGFKSFKKQHRTSVGSKFRNSLHLLMETLNATTPHYVRCIKPNDSKLPFEYDSKRVVQQLRACGVLETIRISAQSYPSRWTYYEFFSRYRILMTQQDLATTEKKQICKQVLKRLIQDPNQYQFGKTKIFFRAGQVAYLEKLRADKLREACVTIQKNLRCWIHRKRYLQLRGAVILMQQYVRGKRAVRHVVSATAIKHAWAAVVIQKNCRRFLVRRLYHLILLATVIIQSHVRGWLARKQFKKMLQDQKALIIQTHVRAWLARRRYQSIRRFVLNIQLSYRVKNLHKKLDEQTKENTGLLERLTHLSTIHSAEAGRFTKLEEEFGKTMAQKKAIEEQAKKSREKTEQEALQLKKQTVVLQEQSRNLEQKLVEQTKDTKEKIKELAEQHLGDIEREERQKRKLENQIQIQQEDYEKRIKVLADEIARLHDERAKLQEQIQDEYLENDTLRKEMAQLANEMLIIPKLKGEITTLETKKQDLEVNLQQQRREMREKVEEVTKQLLGGLEGEELRKRLTSDDMEQLNEDGELWLAYEGLKGATRVLEGHIQSQKESYEKEIEDQSFRIGHLGEEITRLQQLFQEENNTNKNVRQELNRLANENMVIPELKLQILEVQKQKQEVEKHLLGQVVDIKEKMEEVTDQLQGNLEEEGSQRRLLETQRDNTEKEKMELLSKIRQLQTENCQLANRTNNIARIQQEASHLAIENSDLEELLDQKDRQIRKLQDQIRSLTKTIEKANGNLNQAVPKDYLGMLECKAEDEEKLVKHLILDLKPQSVVVNMLPGLPAHILFMCVRHADRINDADSLKSLMNSVMNGIKEVTKIHNEDFEFLSFWLSNSCHFLNSLKQYSGEEEFMKHNNDQQNMQCLENFDLSEYRQIMSDLSICIYQQLIEVMEKELQPMIVPGMLVHESLQGMSSMKPTGLRKRSSSFLEEMDVYTISSILQQLSYYFTTMCQHGMDMELVKQVVKQLFFLIGAVTINNLFLRKDMCSCRKGMQIRCNISYLEEWLKDKNMQSSNAKETLEPLSQAAWLLQVNKTTDDDVKEICEKCSFLSAVQIIKILNSYTPIDDFEKRLAPSFVRKVQSQLQTREGNQALIVDIKYHFQVTFPFSPSPQALETIQIPNSFKLSFLTRI